MKYPKSAVTAKEGVNFVRDLVERAGSLFIPIGLENDLGIDALIEFLETGSPVNRMIALQIKSGNSFYREKGKECSFPIGSHRDYWSNYKLPVTGIVYVPNLGRAFWIDIKDYLRNHREAKSITFQASMLRELNSEKFLEVFLPVSCGKPLDLSDETLSELLQSEDLGELVTGIKVLFRKHRNRKSTWDRLISYIKDYPAEQIPGAFIYFLAHIPWHPDIMAIGEQASKEVEKYARNQISKFGLEDVVKILHCIDLENGISRGSVGQSAEAVISSIPRFQKILRDIIRSDTHDLQVREFAAAMLAMHKGREVLPELVLLGAQGSSYALDLAQHLNEWGELCPY